VANMNWSAPVSWDEACARYAGRRRINAVRQLRAWVRQRAVLRRLRELGGLTRRGIQAQLAREFHVSPSVMSSDIRRIFEERHTRPVQSRRGLTRPRRAPQHPEAGMPHKISVRLPPALNVALQQAACDRGVSPSGLIRAALQHFLNSQTLTPRQNPPAAESLAAPPPDAWEAALVRCPSDVQAKIHRAVDRTGLALGEVLRTLLINAASAADMPQQPG
jgi:hypothetical protein